MTLAPPRVKKAKLSPMMQINDLTDNDLAEIFKRLPLYDRLIASEVCRRWLGISRKAWVNVKHLDLNQIPGKHITSIIRQCPNLASVFACGKSFDLNELTYLSKSCQLSTVKLYDCRFAAEVDISDDFFTKIFGANLQHASWTELSIHNPNALQDRTFSTEFLPTSLTRMQLSGLDVVSTNRFYHAMFLNALDRLQMLECFILCRTPIVIFDIVEGALNNFCSTLFENICALKNLKELSVRPALECSRLGNIRRLIASLPKLEVLFLVGIDYDVVAEDLRDLITKNLVLRILVLSGLMYRTIWSADKIDLPARKRFPHGFASDPLPLLHIFVGRDASEKFRFEKSASDASVIHPINQPMPEFLEREDIAPLFEGVWVAEQIKAMAKHGSRFLESRS